MKWSEEQRSAGLSFRSLQRRGRSYSTGEASMELLGNTQPGEDYYCERFQRSFTQWCCWGILDLLSGPIGRPKRTAKDNWMGTDEDYYADEDDWGGLQSFAKVLVLTCSLCQALLIWFLDCVQMYIDSLEIDSLAWNTYIYLFFFYCIFGYGTNDCLITHQCEDVMSSEKSVISAELNKLMFFRKSNKTNKTNQS